MNVHPNHFYLKLAGFALAIAGGVFSSSASAVPYYYTNWLTADPAGGVATGIITPSSGPVVNVTFAATNSDGTPGSFLGVAGSWLWQPTSTYTSAQVDNASSFSGLQLVGGDINMRYRVTLSEAIKDPLMAIATLGSAGITAQYRFDSPFTILSQGASCCWGGTSTSLVQLSDTVLQGNEGSGTLQFLGTYTTFSWTVPYPEYWHGFTFGIRTTEALEPTPPTGIPEPATLVLVGLGLAGLGLSRRRHIK